MTRVQVGGDSPIERESNPGHCVQGVIAGDADRIKATLRTHLARDGMSLGEARLLRRVAVGLIPKLLGNAETVALGVLANAAIITAEPGGPWQLADDVRYSLLLEPSGSERSRNSV